jgi:hypothetical protein
MHLALKSMCYQVLFEMEREGFVTLVTDTRLKNMGEDVPGKGLLAYDNVLLFDLACMPILSITPT